MLTRRIYAVALTGSMAALGASASGAAHAAANAPSYTSATNPAVFWPAAALQVVPDLHAVHTHQVVEPGTTGQNIASSVPQAASSYHICLTNSPTLCIQSNGAGNQVTITTNAADWSNFRTVRTGTVGSNPDGQIENGNGNCLRAGTNNVVKIENGPCVSGDQADWWIEVNTTALESLQYLADYMLVHGNVDGYNVWHANPISGDWTQWSPIS